MLNPDAPDYACTPVAPGRRRFGYRTADPTAAPFVTILTPFFDAGDLFEATAESVLGQSFQQWEWIVVDDGSTDPASLEVLRRYAALDPRIRVLRQANAGPSAARNAGYAAARTGFVAQIDADDLLEPTAIEKWLWFLLSYPEYGFVKNHSVGFQAERYLWRKGFHTPQEFLSANVVQPNCMIRRAVHAAVGGYDEDNRQGFEDWEFWLRCAAAGHWGGTIPEFLDWYRRRESHGDRWENWDGAERQRAFRRGLRERYPELWKRGMPQVEPAAQQPFEPVLDDVPCENRLQKARPRCLMVLPWMTLGGSDRFNLDLLRQLAARGWDVSIATTLHGQSLWQHEFEAWTSDVFVLENFLRPRDFPRFLAYLVRSRGIDVVLLSHSLLGYLLVPFLRAHCPDVAILDYCHIEEHEWLNGGYPRLGAGYQDLLDLNVTSSRHLRGWMVDRGADPARIEVCHTSVDTERWRPDDALRATVRAELDIGPDVTTLVYPARLLDQKRPRVFADIVRRLHDTGRPFAALVAGDGPDRRWLEAFVGKHGLREVRVLGRVSADRVHDLMAASDVLLLPSRWEGIALSVFEAMACALLVVASDVGGHRELVTPDCGHLVPLGDDEVDAYVSLLAAAIDDPASRRATGARARARVAAEFSLDRMGDRMVELFERATSDACRAARVSLPRGYARETATQALEYLRLQDLAHHLWNSRDERLGLRRGNLRARALGVAYRLALRTPAPVQERLARVYRRFFVDA